MTSFNYIIIDRWKQSSISSSYQRTWWLFWRDVLELRREQVSSSNDWRSKIRPSYNIETPTADITQVLLHTVADPLANYTPCLKTFVRSLMSGWTEWSGVALLVPPYLPGLALTTFLFDHTAATATSNTHTHTHYSSTILVTSLLPEVNREGWT